MAAPQPQPVILLYHRIGRPELDPWGLSVSPENFVQQSRRLGRHVHHNTDRSREIPGQQAHQ